MKLSYDRNKFHHLSYEASKLQSRILNYKGNFEGILDLDAMANIPYKFVPPSQVKFSLLHLSDLCNITVLINCGQFYRICINLLSNICYRGIYKITLKILWLDGERYFHGTHPHFGSTWRSLDGYKWRILSQAWFSLTWFGTSAWLSRGIYWAIIALISESM